MERGIARERAILAAVIALVGEVGYDGMTMDAVAARAQASKATMYRRWRDKPRLVKAALDTYDSGRAPDCPDHGDLRKDLIAFLRDLRAQLTDEHLALMSGLAHAMRRDRELAAALRPHLDDDELSPVPAILGRADERGELGVTDLARASRLVHEVVEAQLFRQMLIGASIDAAFCRHLVDDLLLPLLRFSR